MNASRVAIAFMVGIFTICLVGFMTADHKRPNKTAECWRTVEMLWLFEESGFEQPYSGPLIDRLHAGVAQEDLPALQREVCP